MNTNEATRKFIGAILGVVVAVAFIVMVIVLCNLLVVPHVNCGTMLNGSTLCVIR